MKGFSRWSVALGLAAAVIAPLLAEEIKVDLKKETVGKPPQTFEPMVGTWVVAQDGADKVIMVDGRPWVASKDNPTKLLIESARKLYGTNNEELMDNAKQFAYYPVAVLKSVKDFSNGTITVKFKTVAGDADRASGHPLQRQAQRRLAVRPLQRHGEQRRALGVPQRHPPPGEVQRSRQQVHARSGRVPRAASSRSTARRSRPRSTARSASITRWAPRPARAATAPRPIRISSRTTTP